MMQANRRRWGVVAAAVGMVALAGCSSSGGGSGGTSSGDGGVIVNSSSSAGTASGTTESTSGSSTSSSRSSTTAADASTGDAGGPGGSCDIMDNGHECLDYIGGFAAGQPMSDCAHRTGGTYSATGTCDSASSAGGCKQTFGNGLIQTTWYYDPVTPDAVMATCVADANAVYVAP